MVAVVSDLKALIERVEKATGPDREIDALVFGWLEGLKRNDGTFWIGGRFQFEHPTKRHPNGPAALYIDEAQVPEYTSSLDAVVAMIERQMPGAEWSLTNLYGVALAEVPLNDSENSGEIARRPDGNMVLALLTALLRAKWGDQ
jgi:hypothetical protein